MTSSAHREMSTASIASTNASSAAKSREAVPSIEFSDDEVKPSSAATAAGSRPSEDPASAPDPYGDTAARRSQSRIRSTSRTRACAWAARWCASSTGCACWKCVRPGIAAPGCACAWSTSAVCNSVTIPATARALSRRNIRYSVATWSLRDRPARSLPPRSLPARSSRPRSSAECTSSSAGIGVKAPDCTSWARSSKAESIPVSSRWLSRPAVYSTLAWAFDPAMSYGASTQSKWVLTLSAAISGDGPEANRPPHNGVAAVAGVGADEWVSAELTSDMESVGPGVHGRALAGLLDGLLEVLRLLVGSSRWRGNRFRLPRAKGADKGVLGVQLAQPRVQLQLGAGIGDVQVPHGQLTDPVAG